jgi:hypothetical protein
LSIVSTRLALARRARTATLLGVVFLKLNYFIKILRFRPSPTRSSTRNMRTRRCSNVVRVSRPSSFIRTMQPPAASRPETTYGYSTTVGDVGRNPARLHRERRRKSSAGCFVKRSTKLFGKGQCAARSRFEVSFRRAPGVANYLGLSAAIAAVASFSSTPSIALDSPRSSRTRPHPRNVLTSSASHKWGNLVPITALLGSNSTSVLRDAPSPSKRRVRSQFDPTRKSNR